ncbi:ABC transporter ATP-binding protein [Cellulomonas sp. S1-8]|uniref:ABC transporter ATP-binding protein n=1 Tax=Cellulomonas sp. S1-8 TaxID=2904790 RepID=UPI002244ED0C|nr:oligopeptide/dipeptide ABC transporter ATP-binding protein [Cellulomonas sp. S1-8]UZN04156.1 ATP-binding cassette domain-containing protein [Cellulomonas sp. S1-8]
MTSPVLNVVDLHKEFRVKRGGHARVLTAVDSVSVDIVAGETVALVGESGSGKSTAARCIARLIEPTSGFVAVDGRRLGDLTFRALSRAYGDIQMVFQDPNSSLNPRMTVRTVLAEPLRLHTSLDARAREARSLELLEAVGLQAEHLDRYPSQLSGGQRQRVGIARALAVRPKVLLLDEPTASLDVSVRGHVLALLERLQREYDMAYLFISHDLDVVRRIADKVLVMYLGGIVEAGTTEDIFDRPQHPYTRALLAAAPRLEPGPRGERFRLSGETPSPFDVGQGCRLAGRCPFVRDSCREARPPLVDVSPTHVVACPVVLDEETGTAPPFPSPERN